MSYPQQVPEGWTRGERVHVMGSGPHYAVGRGSGKVCDTMPASSAFSVDEFYITFDSYADLQAWLKWWKQPASETAEHG